MPDLQELLRERQWRSWVPKTKDLDEQLACFERFCSDVWFIKLPEGRQLLNLRDSQREIVRLWLGERWVVNLKARQLGISTVGMAFLFWATFFFADRQVYVLSRREVDAVELAARVKFGYEALPDWVRQRGPKRVNNSVQSFIWDNGSVIESHQSKNSPIRGRTAWCVFCDELAFWEDADTAWAAIEPAAELGGRIFVVSTANGMGNKFETLWHKAKLKGNAYHTIFIPWFADGVHDQDEMDKKRADMPEWLAAQEYPSNAEEAFIRSGRTVFNIGRLSKMETREPDFEGRLEWADGDWSHPEFHDMADGPLSIWEWPKPLGVYAMGVDVAEGLIEGDFSSAHVINVATQSIVATWHGHVDPDIFGEIVASLGWFYGGCLIGVEANNHGMTTLKSLQRTKYQRIYRRRREVARNPQHTELLGWATTRGTKGWLIDTLVTFVRQANVVDELTLQEMRTYVRDDNGVGMHGSPHDDRVMSFAIAVKMLEFVFVPEYRATVDLQGSMDWWFAQAEAQQRPSRFGKRGVHVSPRSSRPGPVRVGSRPRRDRSATR